MSLTQTLAKEFFEHRDGVLYWKKQTSTRVIAGSKAGRVDTNGYVIIGLNRKRYKAHRIIFLMLNGYVPPILDHIDGNRSNNKIKNLRAATVSQNLQNSKTYKSNTSGIKGVSWEKDRNKWKVQIMLRGKNKVIRNLEDLELAELVAIEVRNKYHGEYANHG
jgi:hypothetical protein